MIFQLKKNYFVKKFIMTKNYYDFQIYSINKKIYKGDLICEKKMGQVDHTT